MQLGFVSLLIQRLKSEQPAFYKRLQTLALIILCIVGALWFILWLGIWHIPKDLHDKLNTACYAAGTFIIGVFFTSMTGTKDPQLISNDTKDAIAKHIAANDPGSGK